MSSEVKHCYTCSNLSGSFSAPSDLWHQDFISQSWYNFLQRLSVDFFSVNSSNSLIPVNSLIRTASCNKIYLLIIFVISIFFQTSSCIWYQKLLHGREEATNIHIFPHGILQHYIVTDVYLSSQGLLTLTIHQTNGCGCVSADRHSKSCSDGWEIHT